MSGMVSITELAKIYEENLRRDIPEEYGDEHVLITVPLRLYAMMTNELVKLEKQNKVLKGLLPRN